VGLDLEPCKQRVEYDEAIVGNACQIAEIMNGRQFDNVVAAEFVEHLENPYDFLRSIRRCIAPGGRLIISTPNPVSFPCILFEWLKNRRHFYTTDHTFYFAPRWVERMLDLSGYRVSRVEAVGLWVPPLILPCPATISYQVIYVAEPVSTPCGVDGPTATSTATSRQ
jgi:2-polyprenyl-3-methyl-5-hydroxy-6-metoxy-1,4-benzoquinol methylase